MSNEPRAGKGIDPEMLAAYVDNRLPPDQRAEVEAQLARDPDSYALLVETLEALDDDEIKALEVKEPAARAIPFAPKASKPRSRAWVVAGGVLATAAAIALVVWSQPEFLNRLGQPSPDLEQLVAAVGAERYTEARFGGGFAFGPLKQTSRSADELSRQNLSLIAAAGELQRKAEAAPTLENLHAWGVAQVLLADYDSAIATLTVAVELGDQSERARADLGAAHLARYRATGLGEDLPTGLEHIQRALTADGENLEALFNRALALEWMGLRDEARAAWDHYLQRDSGSAWATYARERLAVPISSNTTDPDVIAILSGLPGGIAPAGRDLQALREFAEEDLLGRAVGAIPADDLTAHRALELAMKLSERLEVLQGDALLSEVSSALAAPGADGLRDAMKCYYRVRQLQRLSRFSDVREVSASCIPLFEVARSPFVMWPRIILARSLASIDPDRSTRLTRQVQLQADAGRYPIISGSVRHTFGSYEFSHGNYARAASWLQEAVVRYVAAGELEHAGGASELRGASLLEIGDRTESWRQYQKALEFIPPRVNSVRWYATRNGVAMAAIREGFPRVAEIILAGNLVNSEANRVPLRIAETRRYLSDVSVLLGDEPAARQHLASARAAVPGIEDQRSAERTEAELLMAEADLVGKSDPPAAVKRLRDSHDLFERLGVRPRLARVKLLETRASRRSLGPHAAIRSSDEGLAVLEKEEAGLTGNRQRTLFRQTTAGLYREAVDAYASADDADTALLRFEQLRRSTPSLPTLTEFHDARSSMEPDSVAIVFCLQTDSVLRWVVDRNGVQLTRRALPAAGLATLVARVRATTLVGNVLAAAESASLADVLLGGLPDTAVAARRWIVIPDGMLFRVPFGVLTDVAGGLVAERREVVNASSLMQFLKLHQRREKRKDTESAAVIVSAAGRGRALPALPAALQEASAIAGLYGVSAQSGLDATRERFVEALNTSDLVHFAGHAVVDASIPWRSHLVLTPSEGTPSGRLFEQELKGGQYRSRVVVLAACSTADGAESQGEGVSSLAAALTGAGVPWVIATLSPIPDEVSREVFLAVHRELLRGASPPAAVRAVQLDGLKSRKPAFTWSSLIVLGG